MKALTWDDHYNHAGVAYMNVDLCTCVPYILEYEPGFLFPSQTLETQRENETGV